ncbi:lamin tail domain-containing protein, partial [Patescibacteria group bacterium]|nr:lamin tail domain-containing protein [Patescibacteria group bacterium]
AKNFLSEIKIWLGDDYAINAWQYIINWQAVDETDEQLNYYQIETKQDQGEWQDLINQTKEKSANFSISQDFTTYYFRAKAVFIDGRESVSKEISAPFASRPVIINEVMYHPEEDAYYEYIELYNLSSAEIDLASWKLKIGETIEKLELATGTSTIIKPNAFVVIGDKPSKPSDKNIYDGFYAIECNSEKICLQIDDASFGNGGLSNQGETIALLNDKDEIIDEISYTKASQDQGKALQKINPYSLSSHESNFSLISGSPNQANPCLNFSAPTHILNDYIIFENTIFTSKASPYLLFSDFSNSPTLAENKTLIIEPGVILKPQNAEGVSLTIQGTLIAKGTSEKPIKFTSPNQEPLPGDYGQALSFTSESKDSVLDYAVFEYGDLIMLSFPMMSVFETNIKIKNSVFRKSLSSALSLIEADAEIENTLFEDNENIGLSIQGGATKIINSSFKNNQLGIDVFQAGQVFLQNNVFSENQKPISFTIDSAINFDETNKMENNNIQGVLINTKKTSQTATNTLEALPFPYVLENSLDIMEGQSLFINPGAVIKLLGDFSIFEVKGNLFAQGTEGNPIIWTSLKDDQYLGDTNNDGENSAPAKGDWQGIQIFNKADLKNIKLRYSIENPIYIKQGAEVIQENVIIE